MIAWIALWRGCTPSDRVRAPQIRKGEHGLDGLLVRLRANGSEVAGVVICEQKATDNTRGKITSQVWPELKDYESGIRDNQLVSEVTALLERENADTVEEIVAQIHWKSQRWYRVSVTYDKHLEDKRFRELFSGFDTHVPGTHERRFAEVVVLEQLRPWMESLANLVVAELQSFRGQISHV